VSSDALTLVLGLALLTAAIKAAGPVAFGGRPLPPRVGLVIGLLAPALLAALVVTQALAHEDHLTIDGRTAGVAVAGIAFWRGLPVAACVLLAALVASGARAVA